ncbi:2-succinyl-5-enolpyruvyl-6-hydroxy-3-cyclohexene-1-carboxylic-acid synthase [Frigoribacterium sp. Leaf186]|uniref:2-succinyl-5-enolpyruvyl-6-hydroxy-3- cyclohexene-1-carboxylic-acid synthase n=1 Tax=Frigoribacterium sp. Leaf186 TaxID=1736293 RepID=UPI0006F38907|nr:2-succinyl-5-enolpyruvyl-6-hydroxy-3-cyclohexene-1-carboxylic-acid synthase [Frigoribacterium sp. Leaf186]KQS22808.1 2-succinyl-5-enolpyruvyl-6-hydroxy-3-cyclohexene-1-carboxylate synthase [Frigoribacterium sp. Leaf186]
MASPSTEYALSLLGALVDAGVRDVVLSPGSRSQALALAAAEFEGAGRLTLHVRIDERSGGFLALGLSAETGVPTVVVTTSGTAVANLHPAVLEAHHSGVPMIVLSADRPVEMRGIGSNQTTVQPGLFATAVGWVRDVEAPRRGPVDHEAVRSLARDAVAEALGGDSHGPLARSRGPVQVNVAFREPLSSGEQTLPPAQPEAVRPPPAVAPTPLEVDSEPATLVVAGHAAGPEAEALARALGAPLVAEVSSGARFGPHLVSSYRALLDDADFGGRVRRVVVFGHPTLSRQVPAVLTREGVEVVVVRAAGAEAYDPSRSARVVEAVEATRASSGAGSPHDPAHRAWVGRWVHTGRRLLEAGVEAEAEGGVDGPAETGADDDAAGDRSEAAERAEFLRREVQLLRRPVTRRALADALWRVSWPHDRLVLGASRLIRELDQVVPGKKIPVHANRGLAGIDGTVATATGIALASQRDDPAAGTTRVLVGDLTLLHDVGSLLLGLGETRPRLQVVVGNDGGGTIFDGLEVAATASAEAMTRVQFTPHDVDLASLARAYGWQHVEAATRAELDRALVARYDGPVLIEVPLAR